MAARLYVDSAEAPTCALLQELAEGTVVYSWSQSPAS